METKLSEETLRNIKKAEEQTDIEKEEKLIKQAKREIDKFDFHLANYILRDSPIVKKTKNLSDLSWVMHQDRNTSKSQH